MLKELKDFIGKNGIAKFVAAGVTVGAIGVVTKRLLDKWYQEGADQDKTEEDQKKDQKKELKDLLQKYKVPLSKSIEGTVIAVDSSRAFQILANEANIFILVRESNPSSVSKKMHMGASKVFPKPLEIKEKSISLIDLEINPTLGDQNLGFVGCFDPFEGFKNDLPSLLRSTTLGGFPVNVTNIPETTQRLRDLKDNKKSESPEEIEHLISALVRIDSRSQEYKARVEKENTEMSENYTRKDGLLLKIDRNVDGEISTRPIVADNDLWIVLAFKKDGERTLLKPVSDENIKETFHHIRGESSVMHGAHTNWKPNTESEKKIDEAVRAKQLKEPLVVFVPGQNKPLSMTLDSFNKMTQTIERSPSQYFANTESRAKKRISISGKNPLDRFKSASIEVMTRSAYRRKSNQEKRNPATVTAPRRTSIR